MNIKRLSVLCAGTALMLAMLAGCDNYEPAKREKIANPTCEDLGKVVDEKEHKALLAKCPGYLPGGRKRSQEKEW
ncbi:MAG: entry exclusion lipoprotein TrbK [Nitrosospira sp.]